MSEIEIINEKAVGELRRDAHVRSDTIALPIELVCLSHEELRARLAVAEERLAMADSLSCEFTMSGKGYEITISPFHIRGEVIGWGVERAGEGICYGEKTSEDLHVDGTWKDECFPRFEPTCVFPTLDAAFAAWDAAKEEGMR